MAFVGVHTYISEDQHYKFYKEITDVAVIISDNSISKIFCATYLDSVLFYVQMSK